MKYFFYTSLHSKCVSFSLFLTRTLYEEFLYLIELTLIINYFQMMPYLNLHSTIIIIENYEIC